MKTSFPLLLVLAVLASCATPQQPAHLAPAPRSDREALAETEAAHSAAQRRDASPASRALHEQIASLDATFFDAYNTCDLVKVETFFAEDVEFFHEKGGVLTNRKSLMEAMKNNLCGDGGNRVRRELVEGTLEVHAINNYGAVAAGEHRFYLTQKDQEEKLDGIGKFVNLWQEKDGRWTMTRVISYGFRPGE